MKKNLSFFLFNLCVAMGISLAGCYHFLPTVVEEVAEPDSTSKKVARQQVNKVKRWVSKPIGGFEKQFDTNHNGLLEPDEVNRLRMARGYYMGYGNVWKYDKDKNFRIDQEEYQGTLPEE